MTFIRVALVLFLAICNQRAFTSPNATPKTGRYNTEDVSILQFALLAFKIQIVTVWICTAFEILFYIQTSLFATSLTLTTSFVCLTSEHSIRNTPFLITGVIATTLGVYIRLDCFRALGQLFTFDLTVLPEHKLITNRFYSYVRHPAYTGSILIITGLAFSHLTPGSWLTECGPLHVPGSAVVVCTVWWSYMLAVAVNRATAEDNEMRKLFGAEWEAYAVRVPWWFFPGLI